MIDKLQKLLVTPSELVGYDFDYGYNFGIESAITLAEQLYEPEKPVVPPCIDRWIQGCKYNGFDLLEAITMSIDMPEETGKWINDNPETFAKAWLYDYEVEKEKLYRAKNRHTGEYLCYCFGFFHDKNSSSENQRFTAEEKRWEELCYWGNGLYDFEEVEGEDE